ncbi:MAG: hypothetical protein ACRCUM_02495 [Mycoplasmoidaceae bacterium]
MLKYLIKFIDYNVGTNKTEFFKCENTNELFRCIDLYIDSVNWCISDNDLIYRFDNLEQIMNMDNITINHIERMINNNNKKLVLFKSKNNFEKCICCKIENIF